jgi:histidyl-tRNA synthetase
MSIKVESVSGFPEWLPNQRLVEERCMATIREQYQLFGFTPIETPAIERMDVLTAKGGMQRQIFTLGRPQEGGDTEAELGLHFDLTVPLARYVAQHAHELVFPFRRYQVQKVWRGERAQRGRFREFYQCDIDIVGRGSLDLIHDAEIPCVINATFTALGVNDFLVHVSNRKILRDLLQARGQASDQLAGALRAIDKTDRVGLEETKQALAKEGIDANLIPAIIDLVQCRDVGEAEKIFASAGVTSEGLAELRAVVDSALALGMPAERLRPNFRIARGLDYYTGTVYETLVTGREKWGSVCSGGRYDDLASYFSDMRFPGVGISIGWSRLFDLLMSAELIETKRNTPTQVLVTTQDRKTYLREYLAFAAQLRAAGIPTEVYLEPGGLRDQIGYAASNGIPYAIIAGSSEFQENCVTIRDLSTRKQEKVAAKDLASFVRNRVSSSPSNNEM